VRGFFEFVLGSSCEVVSVESLATDICIVPVFVSDTLATKFSHAGINVSKPILRSIQKFK
jgi:hypothetical protein